MGTDAKNTDVFQLLQTLKESNGIYPKELLAIRRQGYLKQVAEISAAAGLATALKSTARGAQGAGTGLSSGISTLIESLLVVAIVAEAGAVTYFYRDKLAALYNNLTTSPKVDEISSPPVISSPVADIAPTMTPTPVFTLTVTETPIVTPSQLAESPTHQPSAQSDTGNETNTVQNTNQEPTQSSRPAVSTPDPHGNNGNHYGQTPIPARTKEPGGNNPNNNAQGGQPDPKHRP